MNLEERVKSIKSFIDITLLLNELGYQPEPLRISPESLGIEIKQKEGISEIRRLIHYSTGLKPDFQVYYFDLRNFSRPLISAITRKFSLRSDKYLLIFSDRDFSRLAFSIFVKLFSQEKAKPQVRILFVDRENPARTDLDIINGFCFEKGIAARNLFQKIASFLDLKKVTKTFFKEYRELLLELQELLKKTHLFDKFEDIEAETRRYAQVLLGRLMFLYFIQKKEWLNNDKRFIEHLYQNTSDEEFFNQRLNLLFYETLNKKPENRSKKVTEFGKIPFLNGGLFEKDPRYPDDLFGLPNEFFGKLIQFFNSYNFTVEESTPLDVTIAIDPEMLGQVFENLLVEEERGRKGTFYTPREIVHYMCRESLKEYLISESQIDKFKIFDLFEEEKTKQFSEKEKERLLGLLESAKVIDPAVGSGAFPVGMMHEIIRLRKLLDPKLAKIKNDYNLKKEIIQNNLYGIDIEPEAIEICRLRHWLTLVVDEEAAINKVEPLPNLDYKFVRGNSLIDTLKGYNLLKLFKEGKLEKVVATKEKIPSQQMALFNVLKDLEERIAQKQKALKKVFSLPHNERKKLEVELYDLHFQYKKLKPKEIKGPVTQEALFGYKESFLEEYHKLRQGFFGIKDPEEKEKQRKVLENYEKIIFGNAKDYIISDLKAQIREIDNRNKDVPYPEISKRDKAGKEKLTNEIFEIEEIFKKYEKEGIKPFFLPQCEFKEVYDDPDKGGFNIVIANPPYVSTKGVSKIDYRDQLEIKYGFIDDLYVHFTFRAFDFARDRHGIVCFITSDTYFTITTKQRMREFLQSKRLIKLIPTPKAFEATVNTAIFIAKDEDVEDYSFTFIDARELEFAKTNEEKLQVFENLKETRQYSTKRVAKFGKEEYNIWLNPDDPLWQYDVDVRLYKNCVKKSFFTPNALNIEIYNKYMEKIIVLHEEWWDRVKTSKNIQKNKKEIQKYLHTLKPGDVTIFGLVTEGERGVDSGNNGRFLAIIADHPDAQLVKEERDYLVKRLESFKHFKQLLNDEKIETIEGKIDFLREKFGDKKIGFKPKSATGGIYRIISRNEVANPATLKDDEKKNGIIHSRRYWVPFDKIEGSEDVYYSPFKFFINWDKDYVQWLKKNSGKQTKYGMPTYRNEFYQFKEGLVIALTRADDILRARTSGLSVFYGKTPKFFSSYGRLSNLTLLAYLNSDLLEYFLTNFIDHTVSNQVNDVRYLPIIASPFRLEELVKEAINIQKQRFATKDEKQRSCLWHKLQEIQSQIDSKVAEIYGINMELKGKK